MKEMKRMRKGVKDRGWQNFFMVLAKGQRESMRKGSLRA
jgi:hypothetical protein